MAEHGTTTRYRRGCRCTDCRAAAAAAKPPLCRCDQCRGRRAQYMRGYLDRHPEQRAKQNARALARYYRLRADG